MSRKSGKTLGTSVQLIFIIVGIVILVLPTFLESIKKFVADIWWLGILLVSMGAVIMYVRFRVSRNGARRER